MRLKPWLPSWRRRMSRIGYSPTGISGFGSAVVYGFSRVPLPPARITTGVCSQSMDMGDGLFIDLIPFNSLFDCFAERVPWRPAEMKRGFAGVGDQTVNLTLRRTYPVGAFGHQQLHSKD